MGMRDAFPRRTLCIKGHQHVAVPKTPYPVVAYHHDTISSLKTTPLLLCNNKSTVLSSPYVAIADDRVLEETGKQAEPCSNINTKLPRKEFRSI